MRIQLRDFGIIVFIIALAPLAFGQELWPFSFLEPTRESLVQAPVPGDENWSDQFAVPGIGGEVLAIAVRGDEVFVGGKFTRAGGVTVNNIAMWNGRNWSALGEGCNGPVYSLAVNGKDVYIGGYFTNAGGVEANNIVKWRGGKWTPLGSGLNNAVYALAANDSNLYAGGYFTKAGELNTNRVAKWNGRRWLRMGNGMSGSNPTVYVLALDDSIVYAGGSFATAGVKECNNIARWTGSGWAPMDYGTFGPVYAIAVDDNDVYIGGGFTGASSAGTSYLVRWDGGTWRWLGGTTDGPVYGFTMVDDTLYIAGRFEGAGGTHAKGIVKWDGKTWSPLRGGLSGAPFHVNAVANYKGGIIVGGNFWKADEIVVNEIARWDGNHWFAIGNEIIGLEDYPAAVTYLDSAVYFAGGFKRVGHIQANYAAKWDGKVWSTLGTGLSDYARALVNDGKYIYVGGNFVEAGNVSALRVARWNGSQWEPMADGFSDRVNALAVNGHEVYAGGDFTLAGSTSANHIAKWDGNQWHALGSGTDGPIDVIITDGNTVYVAGNFAKAGSVPAIQIAKWDGESWSTLGSGLDGGAIRALAVRDKDLFAGGYFTMAGDLPVKYIAKWDGDRWSSMGDEMNHGVLAIAVNGGDLYASGHFRHVGDIYARIVKWQGGAWVTMGRGLNEPAVAFDVNGHDLYAAGYFTRAGGKGTAYYAKWHEPNIAPLARRDEVETREDESIKIHLIANDSDSDGSIDANSVVIADQPMHGTVQNNGDGSVSYSPKPDFSGQDFFVYKVNDLQGTPSNLATVYVTITPVNDAPVLDNGGNMFLTTILMGDTSNVGNKVADIIASAGGDRISDADIGAVEGVAVIGASDAHGTWQYSTAGVQVWSSFPPVFDSSAVLLSTKSRIRFVPKVNFSGSPEDIAFRAWDQTFRTDGATNVDVSHNGGSSAFSSNVETASIKVNHKPLATADSLMSQEDTPARLDLTRNDLDPDGSIVLSTITITKKPAHGTIQATSDSIWYYIPDRNFNGLDRFRYLVKDNDGASSNVANVVLLVEPVNDAPEPFVRLLPIDNTPVRSDSIAFVWTRAHDVDGDRVNYVVKLTVDQLDTSIATIDTSLILSSTALIPARRAATIEWTVEASDGNSSSSPTNGTGRFTLDQETGVDTAHDNKLPAKILLQGNYPNPFNPTTRIYFALPEDREISLTVYNLEGRLVRQLVEKRLPAGYHNILFDASGLASGIYLYRFDAGGFVETKKMVLAK